MDTRVCSWLNSYVALALFGLGGCFGNPDTLGLPCSEDAACFGGQVCGASGVCVSAGADSVANETESSGDASEDSSIGDGDPDTTATGDAEAGDGDGDPGDGDGEPGDGDGDPGDGDGDPGDGDGDGEAVCGDGIVGPGEACDGNALAGKSCADFEFAGGTLSCDRCTFDLSECCLGSGQACSVLQENCCGALTCGLVTNKCG